MYMYMYMCMCVISKLKIPVVNKCYLPTTSYIAVSVCIAWSVYIMRCVRNLYHVNDWKDEVTNRDMHDTVTGV